MHICKINIPGLQVALMGHILSGLSMASLIRICILCKAGCTVIFTDTTVEVIYNTKVILHGSKDPATDLWTLPITPMAILHTGTGKTSQMLTDPFPASSLACPLLGKGLVDQKNPALKDIAALTHSIQTQANVVKFTHQSLCNSKISTLLKAVCKGFLKGCPNLNEELVIKYLNLSPATAKGHMKQPKKGIRSTTPKRLKPMPTHVAPVPVPHQILPLFDEVKP